MTLEERFTEFIRSLQSAEIFDELQLNLSQTMAKKPDFFFSERQFIGEMKSIKTDMKPKGETILKKHEDRPDFPIFFREWEVGKILKYLPDGEQINRQIFYSITSAIEESFEKANRQIRETKKIFNLNDSEGILIILNDLVEILSPDIIAYRVHQLVNKKSQSGDIRYPHISVVWIISEIHVLKTGTGQELLPSIVIINDNVSWEAANDYVNWLQRKWAAYNKIPFIEGKFDIQNKFSKRKKLNPPEKISRSELWKKQYIENQNLRHLSKEELLDYGHHLWYEIFPAFIKGTHEKPPQEKVFSLMELSTHFIEEINHRGIDFRELSPYIHTAFERLQQEGKLKV
ncbi:MAG: hypothetical protein RLZZ507_3870 [Cyanobacteriota bacterium]|jgi:hypothetical protein